MESGKIEFCRCLVPYFTEASKGCFALVDLKLDNCELSCNGAIELLDTLSTLKKPLHSLSIADNSLGSRMAETFGKFLETNVRVLNIEGIGLGSVGFQELQKRITTKLNLADINIRFAPIALSLVVNCVASCGEPFG